MIHMPAGEQRNKNTTTYFRQYAREHEISREKTADYHYGSAAR